MRSTHSHTHTGSIFSFSLLNGKFLISFNLRAPFVCVFFFWMDFYCRYYRHNDFIEFISSSQVIRAQIAIHCIAEHSIRLIEFRLIENISVFWILFHCFFRSFMVPPNWQLNIDNNNNNSREESAINESESHKCLAKLICFAYSPILQ